LAHLGTSDGLNFNTMKLSKQVFVVVLYYIVDGKMTAVFAFVAYPAEYRSSGVMTFIVDASGTIYEKDMGPNTVKMAEAMTAYDPDPTWRHAD
jgi:Protein of unknown function (DUF2950)